MELLNIKGIINNEGQEAVDYSGCVESWGAPLTWANISSHCSLISSGVTWSFSFSAMSLDMNTQRGDEVRRTYQDFHRYGGRQPIQFPLFTHTLLPLVLPSQHQQATHLNAIPRRTIFSTLPLVISYFVIDPYTYIHANLQISWTQRNDRICRACCRNGKSSYFGPTLDPERASYLIFQIVLRRWEFDHLLVWSTLHHAIQNDTWILALRKPPEHEYALNYLFLELR